MNWKAKCKKLKVDREKNTLHEKEKQKTLKTDLWNNWCQKVEVWNIQNAKIPPKDEGKDRVRSSLNSLPRKTAITYTSNKNKNKFSGNCPKVIQQGKKHLFKKIYQILVEQCESVAFDPQLYLSPVPYGRGSRELRPRDRRSSFSPQLQSRAR